MANIQELERGFAAQMRLFYDEGDGTYSPPVASLLRGWNATTLQYQRLTVDNATGGLNVNASVSTSGETRPSTGAVTSVADNAASTTLLAANADRLGLIITNTSSARLYVRMEAAAATTSVYSFHLDQNESYTHDFPCYTGQIRGIWASDP